MYTRRSRRDFLNLGAAGVAGLTSAAWAGAAAAADTDADLVVFNAKVYTVDPRLPQASAFAVKGDRFMAVGGNDDIKGLIGKNTRTYDAKQMTVVPGFIDCHNHAGGNLVMYEVMVGNPFEVEFVTIDSIIAKLRAKAEKTASDTWVHGYFFDDTKVKDNRSLNVHDLDKVSTTLPVVVHHRGGHTSYYNSKALALAGITTATKDMASGTYDRFPDGSLNGRVTDRARVVFQNVGREESFSPEETLRRDKDGAAFISQKFAQYGLTGVHHEGGNFHALEEIRAEGKLKHRVSYESAGDFLEAMIKTGITTGMGDEWIRLGATSEHTADGSFSERTMALSIPYPGSKSSYQGNVTETQEDLNAWVERVHRAGIQVNCHANGDVAIDHVLTAYERADKLFPQPDQRWKITHCSLINDDLVRRIKALGASPAVFSTYPYYNGDKFHFYGKELMSRMMALRTFLDAGVPVCAGSDFQPGPFSPLMALQAMVTRTGWNGETWGANQRITVDEALQVNTINGAYNSHEERIKGSITAGKLADFVILADDPHTVSVDKIKDIQIVQTVVGGSVSYAA